MCVECRIRAVVRMRTMSYTCVACSNDHACTAPRSAPFVIDINENTFRRYFRLRNTPRCDAEDCATRTNRRSDSGRIKHVNMCLQVLTCVLNSQSRSVARAGWWCGVFSACDAVAQCRWCDRSVSGNTITGFCGAYDRCWFGRVDAPSPYES